jgi:hypothetical protein
MKIKQILEVNHLLPASFVRKTHAPTVPVQDLPIKPGADFEASSAAAQFFPKDLYEIVHSTHDYSADSSRYIRSSPDPGFKIEIRNTHVNFWVECKYLENKQDSEIVQVFNEGQLNLYKEVENSFLFLCAKLRGEVNNYFIPFQHISSNDLNFSFIEPYRLNYGLGVRPGMIQQYLRLETTNPVIRF